MEFKDTEFLQLSGLQHFVFCRRQWALIHIEKLWQENLLTVEGDLLHTRAHDSQQRERRVNTLILRSLPIFSYTLGVSGQCDVVEFHAAPDGISLHGETGLWQPYPVEYKHGAPKKHDADLLQLCAQAMCLEEMLCCSIPEGALFYGKTRRRQTISFNNELRQKVTNCLREMHQLFRRGYTPKVKPGPACKSCSLYDLCLPKLQKNLNASSYIRKALKELDDAEEKS